MGDVIHLMDAHNAEDEEDLATSVGECKFWTRIAKTSGLSGVIQLPNECDGGHCR